MIALRQPMLLDLLTVCVALPEDERAQIEAFSGTPFDHETLAAQIWSAIGLKWTIAREDGTPLAVGGYLRQREGVMASFFLAQAAAWRHREDVTRITAGVIRDMLAQGHAHRLETYCLASRKLAQRWYTRIGLKREATLTKYGTGGEDAVLFVATRGDH